MYACSQLRRCSNHVTAVAWRKNAARATKEAMNADALCRSTMLVLWSASFCYNRGPSETEGNDSVKNKAYSDEQAQESFCVGVLDTRVVEDKKLRKARLHGETHKDMGIH